MIQDRAALDAQTESRHDARVKLHRETLGEGPDLALLHGWGMHGGVWEDVRSALARRFRLHLLDLPGHGASPAHAEGGLAGVASAVAQALPPGCHVCGWSLGAQVALRLALDFPERVGRLALVAGTPRFTAAPDWPHGMDAAVFRQFSDSLAHDSGETLKRFLSLQAQGDDAARAVLRRLRGFFPTCGRPDPAALRPGLDMLLESDLRHEVRREVRRVSRPTLLIHGDRDQLVPTAASAWLAANLPAAQLEIFDGAAHAPFLSQPARFAETIWKFMHD